MAAMAVGYFGALFALAGAADARRLAIRISAAQSANPIQGGAVVARDVDTTILIPQGQATEFFGSEGDPTEPRQQLLGPSRVDTASIAGQAPVGSGNGSMPRVRPTQWAIADEARRVGSGSDYTGTSTSGSTRRAHPVAIRYWPAR